MTLDPYKLCPGGTGKKIKFCGCKEIVHQLDEVVRKLEGDQRASAVEQLDRLLEKNPDRACLLAMKSEVMLFQNDLQAAKPSVGTFVVQHPENPIALSLSALIEVGEGNVAKAVIALQRAIELIDDGIPMAVYRAISAVAEALFLTGDVMAARMHLLFLVNVSDSANKQALEMLARIHTSDGVPLLLKQGLLLVPCSPQDEYVERFLKALELATNFKWLEAVDIFESLAQQHPRQLAILKNIAILRSWLGDLEKTIPAWRRVAQLDDISLNDAVEAEAVAQQLDPDTVRDRLDVVNVTYPVHDVARLQEVMLSNRQFSQLPVDMRESREEDEPPPKAAYWLLDRPMPTSGKDITVADVPQIVGQVLLYGRQTDREARVEFELDRSQSFTQNLAMFTELAGDLIGAATGEEVVDQIAALAGALSWKWRFPTDTSPEDRARLLTEQNRVTMFQRLPKIPMSVLGGHCPEEICQDPAYRVRLLATILRLELSEHQRLISAADFNQLRKQLGLPTCDDLDAAHTDLDELPVIRLHRVDPDTLSDEELIKCYRAANTEGATLAVERFARSIITRDTILQSESEHNREYLKRAYESLSHLEVDNARALEYLKHARNLALASGGSAAEWLLSELELRLSRGIADQCYNLIEQIESRHINEPGVGQALYEIFVQYGLIPPDGQMSEGETAETGLVDADGPQEEPASRIWTPDGPQESTSATEGKSKLWVPGMD